MALHRMFHGLSCVAVSIVLSHCETVPSVGSNFLAQRRSRATGTNSTTDDVDANFSIQAVVASDVCDQECFFKGESHTCRARVSWLLSQGQNLQVASSTVNFECQGQCACSFPTPPTPPITSSPGVPASPSCDHACLVKGEWHTCRDRINWLVTQFLPQRQAIDTVNSECQGQCSCSYGAAPSPGTLAWAEGGGALGCAAGGCIVSSTRYCPYDDCLWGQCCWKSEWEARNQCGQWSECVAFWGPWKGGQYFARGPGYTQASGYTGAKYWLKTGTVR